MHDKKDNSNTVYMKLISKRLIDTLVMSEILHNFLLRILIIRAIVRKLDIGLDMGSEDSNEITYFLITA